MTDPLVPEGAPLPAPRVVPVLDPGFRPAALALRELRQRAAAPGATPVELAVEQPGGSVSRHALTLPPDGASGAGANRFLLERVAKFLLWARGGHRLHFSGPAPLGDALQRHYRETAVGRFDAETVGARMFDRRLEVVVASSPDALPAARVATRRLGRHTGGCRIGFDLGASDRKVAAVVDGQVVYSDETLWDPVRQSDPEWHYREVMDSLVRASSRLPRVDAIGGSSAGVYVENRVKVASLFRGVPAERFAAVRDLFLRIRRAWNGVPFAVVNDGEVTALAGSMSLGVNSVLGLAMGSSEAVGYVAADGGITSGINELAFAPVDFRADAPADEWSGDRGCGVQYFSQQAVNRLLAPAGIAVPADMGLPERLQVVQGLMAAGDLRARRIYETIGVYLGYAVPWYAEFYDMRHILVLGRVMTGPGGDVILVEARRVLAAEFPEIAARVELHAPDEKSKRVGQAVAAASLPETKREV